MLFVAGGRGDEERRGENSTGLIEEVATELGLGPGEDSSRWQGEGTP